MTALKGRLPSSVILLLAVLIGSAVAMAVRTDRCSNLGLVGSLCDRAATNRPSIFSIAAGVLTAAFASSLLFWYNRWYSAKSRHHA